MSTIYIANVYYLHDCIVKCDIFSVKQEGESIFVDRLNHFGNPIRSWNFDKKQTTFNSTFVTYSHVTGLCLGGLGLDLNIFGHKTHDTVLFNTVQNLVNQLPDYDEIIQCISDEKFTFQNGVLSTDGTYEISGVKKESLISNEMEKTSHVWMGNITDVDINLSQWDTKFTPIGVRT